MAPASERQEGGDHYRKKSIDVWAALDAWFSPDEASGYYRGNVIKYLMRCREKGGALDLRKAAHYLQKLIEVEEGRCK